MFSTSFRKILFVTMAAAGLSSVALPQRLAAATPDASAKITYTATGTFATPAVSGNDQLKLAGQKFVINIVADSSTVPTKHGPNWAEFTKLSVAGYVHSALLPPKQTATLCQKPPCNTAAIAQIVSTSEDIFRAGFPVRVIGIDLEVLADLTLPGGTLVNDLVRPFASVDLDTTNSLVTYKNAQASTVLAVQSGTVVASLPK